jgi:hypothetical protein
LTKYPETMNQPNRLKAGFIAMEIIGDFGNSIICLWVCLWVCM